MNASATGPDLVIAGAARSGTSLLAARLSTHPEIDAPSVKEPNYFSRHLDKGLDWYDGFFPDRRPGALRLDASVSYTYPQHPEALPALAAVSPGAQLVYLARDPVERAVSHYLFYRHYFEREPAATFGAALDAGDYYLGVSDYRHWLEAMTSCFPADRVLVVPFPTLTRDDAEVAAVVCRQVGLTPPPAEDREVSVHRNDTRTFRNDRVRRMTRALRHSSAYPKVRQALGPYLMRRVRAVATTKPSMPSVDEALASCSAEQLARLEELRLSAGEAVRDRVKAQDDALGLSWLLDWE